MRIGSLCTGYGGLELALTYLDLDEGLELSWVSEIDDEADQVLQANWPEVPNIGDLSTADPEPVDIVTAGFPCQPLSPAGNRKGVDDDRWIWPDILRLVGNMDPPPGMLLLENVPGLLSINDGDAMAQVVEGLAALGYLGSYGILRASDVGACHRRRRWFCAATHAERIRERPIRRSHRGDAGLNGGRESKDVSPRAETPQSEDIAPGGFLPTPSSWLGRRPGNSDLADPGSGRQTAGGPYWRSTELVDAIAKLLPTPTWTDSKGSRRVTAETDEWTSNRGTTLTDVSWMDAWGDYTPAIDRHIRVLGRPAPPPSEDGKLSPRFVEWMMMLPDGWVSNLDLTRTAQLRILGNGVVPYQAAAAYDLLLEG